MRLLPARLGLYEVIWTIGGSVVNRSWCSHDRKLVPTGGNVGHQTLSAGSQTVLPTVRFFARHNCQFYNRRSLHWAARLTGWQFVHPSLSIVDASIARRDPLERESEKSIADTVAALQRL